jgi:metal-sulfur cluster biosynthetic enzyme
MISQESVYQALKTVVDPELGIDIVSLGFIYNVKIEGDSINVDMTLTTRGCPLHSTLKQQAEDAIRQSTGVTEVKVEIVFDPPWNVEMMSAEAKKKLGLSSES